MEELYLVVEQNDEGQRVDRWITHNCPQLGRTVSARLCSENMLLVNGKPVVKGYRLRCGDEVRVTIPSLQPDKAVPQKLSFGIAYEDPYLLVVDKPKGMVVHPAPGNPDGTLVNGLLYHCGDSLSGINGIMRPGIVHRIDKDTSGLLIVAKSDAAHIGLAEQIQAHSFTRSYEAVVYGHLPQQQGVVDAPIGRSVSDRKHMCVTPRNSKSARTHYQVIEQIKGFDQLSLQLETGRTHQIRVHMAYLGHPVAGDPVYGPKKVITSLGGQCLHARSIGFVHPITGESLSFVSDLPDYFTEFIQKNRTN